MHLVRRAVSFGVAGAIGLLAMELIGRATSSWVRQPDPSPLDVFPTDRALFPAHVHHLPDESSTAALGRIAYEKLTGRSPSPRTKEALSWAVHIGYGLAVASLFALLRRRPRVLRDGMVYGAALWLFGDELAVPLLGLADKPTAYHPSRHAQSLAGHLGFGVATAAATRAMEKLS